MQTLIYNPHPIILTDGTIRREPRRPPAHRPPDFAEQFDYHTLLFDAFFCGSNEVLITSPSYFNLLPYLERMTVIAAPSGRRCGFRIRNVDRHSQIRIAVPDGTRGVSLRSEIGQFDIAPEPNHSGFFAGRRVLFTQSKNNRFEWIQDWIRYHRDIHGADAVLIYDNRSTEYSTEQLLDSLRTLSGIHSVGIVNWPFLFGPQGFGAKGFWDSDFCQHGVWEHARWMFLQEAKSAIDPDVDELIVSRDGTSVFAAAEQSRSGVVRFNGNWVHGFKGITPAITDREPARFINYDPYFLRHWTGRRWGVIPKREWHNVCPPKWAVVPKRCPDRAQWAPHRIKGWLSAIPLNRNFSFRHFREISNHWKYDRSARELFDAGRYAFDPYMRSAFSAVQWTS